METSKRTKEYYTFVGEKNVEGLTSYLHPDVELSSPLATVQGKEAVLQSIKNFISSIQSLTLQATLGKENQGVAVYHVDMPGVDPNFLGVSLLTFNPDGLITNMQIFYDAASVLHKKEEIFS